VRTRIETRFADSRAADLSLAYGLPRLPSVAEHFIVLHGVDVELRLLGASHQVIIGAWSETVACLPDRADKLPAREEIVENGLRFQFAAQTLQLAGPALSDRVAGIIRECTLDEHAIVGSFPGSPLAITAVRAWEEKVGTAWRTWHVYPQGRELVETRTVVTPL
jgi:uncharacterized protein DUF2617